MKSLLFSMLFLLSFLAHSGEAAIPCTTVDANAAACLGFATGKAAKPSSAFCDGLQQLAQTVKSVEDKKAICRCLKVGAKSLGIQDRFLNRIPRACNIKVGFPVSVNTNCEMIH
ncbi:hypothetical protein ES332_A05G120900v1 [Gossypium tomentosum]|uniref:Non-specific lipid-transfer protein n=1 Tax=Gossypium tomentosum TaxID=34277 RepID=A0A5D2QDH6_GOSTO|nr:hypothetical protein ES332_A05G120900v1 [Gossypium tomentosum]